MSLVEAATNVGVGYVLAILTQIVIFPWFGIDVGAGTHMAIGLVFLGVSLIRSYLLRRLFEGIAVRHVASDNGSHDSRVDRGRRSLGRRRTRDG